MKAYTFTMNGHVYFSPSVKAAFRFLDIWNEDSKVTPFETTWNIESIERAPKWVPEQLNVTAQIEYEK